MTRFNTKIGAVALATLGLVYMIASLATEKTATAHYPPDLEVDESQMALSPWQAAQLLIHEGKKVAVIDVRDNADFQRYSVPMSENRPSSTPKSLGDVAANKALIIIAKTDEKARTLAAETRRISKSERVFYLGEGAGSWYLAFEMPISLFNEQPPPFGYEDALKKVRAYFENEGTGDSKTVETALATLTRLHYEPTKLGKKKKPNSSGQNRKKIAGGCG